MRDAHKIGSTLHFWPIASYPKLTFSRLSRHAVTGVMISAACWRVNVAAGLSAGLTGDAPAKPATAGSRARVGEQ